MSHWQGKIVLITGGGSGIGATTARAFAAQGAHVFICGRRLERLEEVCHIIAGAGGEAEALHCDISDEQAVKDTVQQVMAQAQRLDVLVNNAYSMVGGKIEDLSAEDWHANFRTSLDGAFFTTRSVLPIMRQQRSGSIVNVSSIVACRGGVAMSGYGAAKAALMNFTMSAAMEAAPFGVRVNAVVPGIIHTPPTASMVGDPGIRQALEKGVPLHRIGTPEEVAAAILFLASDAASYITGSSLMVDGGKAAMLDSQADMEDFQAN